MVSDKPLMYIEWTDAASCAEWRGDSDEGEFVVRCKTIGFLVKDTDEEIVISPTIAEGENQYASYFAIPTGCVINRWIITINNTK